MANNITIEVAYATAEKQKIISLSTLQGITAIQAVLQSKINQDFTEIKLDDANLANVTLGIFGKKCPQETELYQNDRVEIYRPLIADPKQVRKQRAAAGKKMSKGGSK